MKPVILYEDLLTLADTLTATDTDPDPVYDADNVKNFRTYQRWKAASTGVKYITLSTSASPREADAVGVAGHNFGSLGTLFSVERFVSGPGWTSIAGPYAPTDDAPFIVLFTTANDTDFRLVIDASAGGIPEVGVVVLGNRLTFENHITGTFDPDAEQVVATAARSRTGNLLGADVRFNERRPQAHFERLTPAWVTANLLPFWRTHAALIMPFFFAWDYDREPTNILYADLGDNPRLSLPFDPVRRSFDLMMRGIR